MALEPAGAAWCAKFPTSRSIGDLVEPFQTNVQRFVGALAKMGANVAISATYRPPGRAYLMHVAGCIAGFRDKVSGHWVQPPAAQFQDETANRIGIDWTCGGDAGAARRAAEAMCATYGIVYPATLTSRHTECRAIDMTIDWKGKIWLVDADGRTLAYVFRDDAVTNDLLAIAGKSFGVIKLPSDPPHWSDDGH